MEDPIIIANQMELKESLENNYYDPDSRVVDIRAGYQNSYECFDNERGLKKLIKKSMKQGVLLH
jgi:hypothetical protein